MYEPINTPVRSAYALSLTLYAAGAWMFSRGYGPGQRRSYGRKQHTG